MAGGDRRRRRTEGVVAPPRLGAERRLLPCLFLLGALFGLASAATRPWQDIRCQFIPSGCVGKRKAAVIITNDGGETLIGTIFPAAVQGNTVDVAVVNAGGDDGIVQRDVSGSARAADGLSVSAQFPGPGNYFDTWKRYTLVICMSLK
uniref:Uncharacterized protein n=1 Tax=Oryza barthii TaxID=65489 RepID=A0A0D3H616_9ORYZ